jgi:hypothetical protein
MRRVIAVAAALHLAIAAMASAQSATPPSSSRPLADVAKQEEARRKAVKKPAKVYTNDDLRTDISPGVAPPPTAADAAPSNTSPSNMTPAAPSAETAPAGVRDQAYWQGRIAAAREQLQRSQIFADSLQSRINALTTDFVNRDDPVQKARIEQDRKTALAELERVRKEIQDHTKAIADIEEEARRANVPAGWLRPGA